jgi:peptidoglycan/xylan/chitin deacetylase (PgdA/CDA1 family)
MGARPLPSTCVVLYYHGIGPGQRDRFARQMDLLVRHAKPIRSDFAASLPSDQHFACVTFDDAMVSFAKTALPELEKRKIPSTVFVVSGKMGQPPDWANYSDEPLTTELTMNSNQLREISDRVLIGSHTSTHPMLTRVSESEARNELEESRKALEDVLNDKVTQFSFPYGDFNDELVRWCHEAGYGRVFTTLPLVFESGQADSVVGRISVEPTDWPLEFRLKVLGAYQWLLLAFTVKRAIRLLLHKAKGPKRSPRI